MATGWLLFTQFPELGHIASWLDHAFVDLTLVCFVLKVLSLGLKSGVQPLLDTVG